ncbi:hypothetical protein Tco_1372507, partial [Tanacetum coccineum]
ANLEQCAKNESSIPSKLVEEQGNQPSTTEAVKVLDQNVEEEKDVEFVAMEEVAEEQSLEIPTVEQLLDEADKLNKSVQETPESPYDTESKIKAGSDSDLQSMPDDDLRSVLGIHTADSDDTHDNEVSLHSRLGDMESSIVQQVSADFKSSLPALITDSLKNSCLAISQML